MRRLFWVSVGAVAGASGTIWTERKVRQRLDTLHPDHVALVAADRARSAGRTVLDAVTEGREAMREREAQLRLRRDAPSGRADSPPSAARR